MTRAEALALLGITDGTSHREVARAYRRAAKLAHPDHGGNAADFLRLRDALEVLTTGKRRTERKAKPPAPAPIVVPVSAAMLKVGANVPVPVVHWKQCGGCAGIGTVRAKRGRCPHCKGSGHYAQGMPEFLLPCGPCNGTGSGVLQCKECHGSGRRLAGVQTTIRIKPGTPDGTLLNVPTLDGPVRIQLKAVAMRR